MTLGKTAVIDTGAHIALQKVHVTLTEQPTARSSHSNYFAVVDGASEYPRVVWRRASHWWEADEAFYTGMCMLVAHALEDWPYAMTLRELVNPDCIPKRTNATNVRTLTYVSTKVAAPHEVEEGAAIAALWANRTVDESLYVINAVMHDCLSGLQGLLPPSTFANCDLDGATTADMFYVLAYADNITELVDAYDMTLGGRVTPLPHWTEKS